MIEMRWVQTGDGHEDSPIGRRLQFRQGDYSIMRKDTSSTISRSRFVRTIGVHGYFAATLLIFSTVRRPPSPSIPSSSGIISDRSAGETASL